MLLTLLLRISLYRYDPYILPDISSLDPLFSKADGFWSGSLRSYDSEYNLSEPQFENPFVAAALSYPYPARAFFNITIDKTRWEQHDLYVLDPAPAEFCAEPVPPGFSNVVGDGECGVTGHMWAADAFKASTHNKTDQLVGVSGTGGYTIPPESVNVVKMIPIGELQLMDANYIAALNWYTTSTYTFDDSFNNLLIEFTTYSSSGGTISVFNRLVINMNRIDDGETWIQVRSAVQSKLASLFAFSLMDDVTNLIVSQRPRLIRS